VLRQAAALQIGQGEGKNRSEKVPAERRFEKAHNRQPLQRYNPRGACQIKMYKFSVFVVNRTIATRYNRTSAATAV
jgi:hypothetical protein